MTLEEKLENISQAAIEDATKQGDALIQEYQQDIDKAIKIFLIGELYPKL